MLVDAVGSTSKRYGYVISRARVCRASADVADSNDDAAALFDDRALRSPAGRRRSRSAGRSAISTDVSSAFRAREHVSNGAAG